MRNIFRILSVLIVSLLICETTQSARASTITIGETNVLSTADSGNGNLLAAQNATLSQPATIQSLSFYVTQASGNLILGIYDASGPNGGPGALKAETNSFAPVVGWNTANVIAPVSLPAGTYWLAYLPSSNSLSFMKGLTSGVSIRYYSYRFGALPAQFSTSPYSDPNHWSFYGTLNPAPTISSVSLSNNSFTAGAPAGAVIGAISVKTSSGSFTGSLSLSGANASSFKIVGSNLETNGVLSAGSYNINIVATQSGAANSPFTQAETITAVSQSISSVSLSNASFVGGSPSGTVVGPINVAMSPSSPTFSGSLSLSTTQGGCTASNGANNSSFAISGNNLVTNGTVAPGSYAVCILATQAGAANSPLGQAKTITASQSISSISLPNRSVVGGSPSGTVVGTINVAMSPSSPAFSGSLSLSTTQGGCTATKGANNSSFAISGNNLVTNGTVASGSYAVCILATQAGAPNSPFGQTETITASSPTSQSISSIALSNNSTTTGLSSGTSVGTLSVIMSPMAPTFSYSGANLHLSASGTDSGGVCSATNGAGNGSFQIINGDTLATNGTLTKQNYNICVAAAEGGVAPKGQTFTIAIGNRIDAAATYCASNGGGNGSSGSPWHAACIQAAVNAASTGDTVFLAAGNWALSTGDTAPVSINKAINLIGAGSGNTTDAYGHINNGSGTTPCPAAGTSITCVYPTGTSFVYGGNPGDGGTIKFGLDAGGATACVNETVAHILFDASLVSPGGDDEGLLNFEYCVGPITLSDIRFYTYGNSSFNGETELYTQGNSNVLVQNSFLGIPLFSGSYGTGQAYESILSNGITLRNNLFWQGTYNPTDDDSILYTGNTTVSTQNTYGGPGIGVTGCHLDPGNGPGLACPTTGSLGGTFHATFSNNYQNAGAPGFAMGGGVNDPNTNGGISDLHYTGNWLTGSNLALDACSWNIFGAEGNCSDSGMIINAAATAAACVTSWNGNPFSMTNNSLIGTASAQLNAGAKGTTNCFATGDTSTSYHTINLATYGFDAEKNYLQSPSNQYNFNSQTFSPRVVGNYCDNISHSGASTFTQTDSTQCATSGFTVAPTVLFTLGNLSGTVVPFTETNFTAQYGAVEWLASTSSTTPTSSGQTGTGAAWSYTPPVQLSSVTHGNTVYLWTMDSLQHISSAATALIP